MGNKHIMLDAVHSDPKAIHDQAGSTGRMLIRALDKAVKFQTSTAEKYIERLRKKNPDASSKQLQQQLDRHFLYLATSSGAGAGATTAIPGLGLIGGVAAVSAESILFLDAAAFYTIASAQLRGIDIRDVERRRALVLVTLIGTAGTALVDATVGDLSRQNGTSIATVLTRFGIPRLRELNTALLRTATNQVSRTIRSAWLGKLMPLGIGAVIGTVANRKLAKRVIVNAQESLGPLPQPSQ